MHTVVISADRFEDNKLSEPLRPPVAKGVVMDGKLITSRKLADFQTLYFMDA